jgi:triose/dihydroxyacetone kinase / FAD-AMP lyase (cyclizing)
LVAGVLVLVINYTGDRINFGLAVEKARREGLKVSAHAH